MEQKIVQFRNRGMRQDESISKASDEFAFKNINVRITAVNDNTLFSVTNEKGVSKIEIVDENNSQSEILGAYIGKCIIDKYLILFTKQDGNDRIYRCYIEGNKLVINEIANGYFNFSKPVETVGSYERDDIIKVYWVDGVNPNRVINIMAETQPDSFDFLPTVNDFPSISVTKQYGGNGKFPAGVIQYFVSYYNKLGQETKIVAATDLQYISFKDRGGKADEIVNLSFILELSNLDTSFDYVRVYSAKRSSIDGPIDAQIVGDYKIDGTSVRVIDNNIAQASIDSSLLYYIGGDTFIASTIEDKDGVLFLGNIQTNGSKKDFEDTVAHYFQQIVDIKYVPIESVDRTYKNNEWYKIAVQLQYNTGEWSEPIFVKNLLVEDMPPINDSQRTFVSTIYINTEPSSISELNEVFDNNNIVNYRLLIAETSESTRNVIAQGVINPTVFNIYDRYNNSPFSIASWVSRPRGGRAFNRHMESVNVDTCYTSTDTYKKYADGRAEIQFSLKDSGAIGEDDGIRAPISSNESLILQDVNEKKNYFYIDESILNFNSPEITYNDYINNSSNLKFRIVGIINIDRFRSDYRIDVNNVEANKYSINEKIIDNNNTIQLISDYLYNIDFDNTIYSLQIYPWQRSGSLIYVNNSDSTLENKYILSRKVFSNYISSDKNYYFKNTSYFEYTNNIQYSIFNDNELVKLNNGKSYYGKYDTVVAYETKNSVNYYDHSSLRKNLRGFTYNPIRIKYNTGKHAIIDTNKMVLPSIPSNSIYWYTPLDDKNSQFLDLEKRWRLNSIYNSLVPNTYVYDWYDPNGTRYIESSYVSNVITDDSIYVADQGGNRQTDRLRNQNTTSYLFIGELYRELTVNELYGNSLSNIKWIPISDIFNVDNTVDKTNGDTYYKNWECLRTYPTTEEDENSVVDIVSFMVETHINLDGRCDINKGYTNQLNARPTNFGLMNDVYSQQNNIFKYNILDERFDHKSFPNQFAWSLNKQGVSEIDTWTSATLSNIKNVDGSYGPINAIEKLNDTLIGFQDRAIFAINFNNRTQISTEQGLPIELANSGKVDGVTYITRNYGCNNKYSIVNAKSGIYFIDDENRALIRIGKDGLADISTAAGMSVWFRNIESYNNLWGGGSLGNAIVLQYDSNRGDIYIMRHVHNNESNCIVYNEILQSFTSFFDNEYEFPLMYNFGGETYSLYGNSFYKMFGGSYLNNYSIDYRINPEPLTDKVFTNLEYIADCTDSDNDVDTRQIIESDIPFSKIEAWNEYQYGSSDITEDKFMPNNYKQKFRIRRVDIPRDSNSNYGMDRMRNPWIHLRLSRTSGFNHKMTFHSMLVRYFK